MLRTEFPIRCIFTCKYCISKSVVNASAKKSQHFNSIVLIQWNIFSKYHKFFIWVFSINLFFNFSFRATMASLLLSAVLVTSQLSPLYIKNLSSNKVSSAVPTQDVFHSADLTLLEARAPVAALFWGKNDTIVRKLNIP